MDLSSPEGHSVNNAIPQELCSVTYASLDQAVTMTQPLGKGCLLAKLDLREAYRAVPVHPSDQCLLAVQWKGATYIDRALPFGLRSAPKLFSALTDAMMWFLYERGVGAALHYLDDFLLLGPPDSASCGQALSTTLALCEELGFPVAPEKTEGPTTVLTFLGIELDTSCQVLRLPDEKRERLLATILQWSSQSAYPMPRGSGKKRDLLSLIGLLSHAAMVVRPGRAFLRSLFHAASLARELDHWVHLSKAARADLAWWYTFLQIWNGKSTMPPSNPSFVIRSDASGSWGCGAVYDNLWFQLEWPPLWKAVSIAPKELVPIVMAVVLTGQANVSAACVIMQQLWRQLTRGRPRTQHCPICCGCWPLHQQYWTFISPHATSQGFSTYPQMHCHAIDFSNSFSLTLRQLQSQPSSHRS